MEDFDPIEKKIKTTKETMNFVSEFLENKKYGFGILFFVLFIIGIAASIMSYKQGKADQALNSAEQIKSLIESKAESNKNDDDEIKTLQNRVAFYKKKSDDCENISSSQNLEEVLSKRLEENERLKQLIRNRISTTDNQQQKFDNLLKN